MEAMTLDELHSAGIFLAGRNDWRTPRWFIDLVNAVSPITFDPANSSDNWTKAEQFFARLAPDQTPPPGWLGLCGLAGDWSREGNGFVNPPYGPHLGGPIEPEYVHTRKMKGMTEREVTGVGRGWVERITQDRGELHVLMPGRTDTAWWQAAHAWCDLALLWKSPTKGSRIQFIDPDTGEAGRQNNMSSTVFYKGPNIERFIEVFGEHGRLIPGALSKAQLLRANRPVRMPRSLDLL